MPPIRMVTFTEKERKWILSDPGEIALSVEGNFQGASMFIESPSSLDLMLGTEKKPSWDCGCTNSSRTLRTECPQQNELNPKAPHHKRKRKPSWGGGFDNKESFPRLDIAENRFASGERIGHSPVSESVCNLQIQYVAQKKALLEALRIESGILKEFEQGTNQLQPTKNANINLDKNIAENRAQQCAHETRREAKVPNSVTRLRNSGLEKRLKKFEASEFEENSHSRQFSGNSQEVTPQNTINLLIPSDVKVEEGSLAQKRFISFLPATSVASQAGNGDVPSAPSSLKESTRSKRDFVTTQPNTNQVNASRADGKDAENFLSAGSVEKQHRRIQRHGREDRFLIEQMQSATSSVKKENVSQRATYVQSPKKCFEKASANGNCSTSSLRENSAKGSQKSAKSETAITSGTQNCDAEMRFTSLTLRGFPRGYPKSVKSEPAEIPQIPISISIAIASPDGSANGFPSSTVKNSRGDPKPTKSEAARNPLTVRSSRDEVENRPNKKDLQDGQARCKQRLGDSQWRKGGNGTPDENCKENHMNVDDAPVEEDFDAAREGNARMRTQRLLKLFNKIHKQFKGGHKEVDVRNIIVECYPEYLVNGSDSIYGEVPGVEVGDTYKYRVEMDLVGLHHQFRRGIDVIPASRSTWCFPENPKPVSVAACVVVAGGYVDNRDAGDIIIYTGEGGNNHFQDKGPSKDQMLTFGNKALRHSKLLHLCVRVIRKFDNKPPKKPFYRYDGLYDVVDMRKDRSGGHCKKQLCHGEIDATLKGNIEGNRCKNMPLKPLVYKFLLVKKSAREKYKNVKNLWTYKPLVCA